MQIIQRQGDGSLLSRRVTRDSANRLTVENERLVRGRRVKLTYKTTIHPEDYTCDVEIIAPGVYHSSRHYTFTEVGSGTKLMFLDNYTLLTKRLRIADAFGIIKRRLEKTSAAGMKAYVAQAEEELSEGNEGV